MWLSILFFMPVAGHAQSHIYKNHTKEALVYLSKYIFNRKQVPGRYQVQFDATGLARGCISTGSRQPKKQVEIL